MWVKFYKANPLYSGRSYVASGKYYYFGTDNLTNNGAFVVLVVGLSDFFYVSFNF